VDGLVLCSGLMAIADVPIVICSATPQKRDAILGLKLGADDFVAKPFDIYELEARLEAVLRRSRLVPPNEPTPRSRERMRVGTLTIEPARRRVLVGTQPLGLTAMEFRLLSALAARHDEVVTRKDLAVNVWDDEDAGKRRTIDVHVRRLRAKLGAATMRAPSIVAVHGVGYKLVSG
jgi:DNA-binding response OmpR family regulator